MNKKDYYDVLGISKSANEQEIKRAYRKKAKQLHPDVNKSTTAEKDFKELNEAYDVLKDTNKRAAYDRFGHNAGANQSNFGKGGFGGGFNQGSHGFGDSFNFNDIFDQFFSGGNSSDQGNFSGTFFNQGNSNQRQGRDTLLELNIDFMDSLKGKSITIKVNTAEKCIKCHGTGAENVNDIVKCQTCNGHGVVQQSIGGLFLTKAECRECNGSGKIIKLKCNKCMGKKYVMVNKDVKIKIPEGIQNGQHIKVKGYGLPSTNGVIGDLYIKIKIKPHPIFRVENQCDIVVRVPIHFIKAAIGCKIMIPTPNGYKHITIPSGTQNNQKFKIKGVKGMKNNNHSGFFSLKAYGNFWVEINIIIPKESVYNREQISLLNKFSNNFEDKNYNQYLEQINKIKI